MPKPYSQDLRERVARFAAAGGSRRAAAAHFQVSVSFVVNLMTALRVRRHAKLEPHRVFILDRVTAREDISMPELARDLEQACAVKADPASLSRWLIRNGFRFKKLCRPANAIVPTFARRARSGFSNANLECGLSRSGWSSSTRRQPTRK